ncbi:MAG: hypothetical protein SFU98_07595 [Leptospiraceae bacterium]|nr:hypothetical protein [Leptospiraceae bacterium]
MKILLYSLILFLLSFCKGGLSESQKSEIVKIFQEHQKIQETLVANPKSLPEIKSLIESLRSGSKSLQGTKAESLIKSSLEIAEKTNLSSEESYFDSLSKIAENLGTVMKETEVASYHLFYCPMLNKYWVAKGETLVNPYAPDMRDCGEMVK